MTRRPAPTPNRSRPVRRPVALLVAGMLGLVTGLITALVAGVLPASATPTGAATTPGTGVPAAASLPGGKANWVVSVGGLNTPAANSYRNWTRLGYYTFDTGGHASTSYWAWQQRDQPVRVDTVTADCGASIPTCRVKTVQGFTDNPTGGYRGTYSYTPDGRLRIDWATGLDGRVLAATLTEYWTLQTGLDGGKLVRMVSPTFQSGRLPAAGAFSNYTATFGVGWGSNAPLTSASRAGMSALLSDPTYRGTPYKGKYDVANGGRVSQQHAGFGPLSGTDDNPWKLCGNKQCIGWLQSHTHSCTSPGYPNHNRVRYIAQIGDGRRNTQWYWCQFHAESQHERCYQSNSHPQPMLQIVDDAGVFRGWVGTEVFTHVKPSNHRPDQDWKAGYFAVFELTGYTQFH